MEGGLHQPTLSPMELVFAREQPFAQQMLGQLEAATLVKATLLGDEQVFDQIRVVEEMDAAIAQADERDISIIASHTLEQPQRVAPKRKEELTRKARRGTRRRAEISHTSDEWDFELYACDANHRELQIRAANHRQETTALRLSTVLET
jgi:hypothetical protein